ncbi:protein of unknown function DUF55 [Gloeothece citriformis PCC 7424]|uniref:EVE domain-containing protein n=1 Tax=Gloeothece citriformis (strain PCC 7424) TaxID=65393 RepID=B7KAI8_GLOC7|nr:protein of unknown function DUF55 [Gloeothece citriformis PCC 7424]
MKSEPDVYSIDDLKKEGQTLWDGVRNYQARNFLRQMKVGDLCFFYHSNLTPPAIVGLMKVIQSNVVDPTQFDSNSPYYDSKSKLDAPRWQTVIVDFVKVFPNMIPLTTLKQLFNPEELLLIRKGNRLSVMPIEEKIAQKILSLVDISGEI